MFAHIPLAGAPPHVCYCKRGWKRQLWWLHGRSRGLWNVGTVPHRLRSGQEPVERRVRRLTASQGRAGDGLDMDDGDRDAEK